MSKKQIVVERLKASACRWDEILGRHGWLMNDMDAQVASFELPVLYGSSRVQDRTGFSRGHLRRSMGHYSKTKVAITVNHCFWKQLSTVVPPHLGC